MLIQVTTDNHITGRKELASRVQSAVQDALHRFGSQVTRVEIHLADENAQKKGDRDKRCSIEARLAGLSPVAASDRAGDLDQALTGALDKLVAQLEHTVGRLGEHKGHTPFGGESAD